MVFYFTGMGNSFYVAKSIADGDRLVLIGECFRNNDFEFELGLNESVGFVFPVFGEQ